MTRNTGGFLPVELPSARVITKEDAKILGELMYLAYQGAVDYDGETLEQSTAEVEETLKGKYGPIIWEASFVVMDGDRAASAIVFVDFPKEKMPLLAFTMTRPESKGQGLSRKLITLSLRELEKMGIGECCLVVTEGNQPAQGLYERLGFQYKS